MKKLIVGLLLLIFVCAGILLWGLGTLMVQAHQEHWLKYDFFQASQQEPKLAADFVPGDKFVLLQDLPGIRGKDEKPETLKPIGLITILETYRDFDRAMVEFKPYPRSSDQVRISFVKIADLEKQWSISHSVLKKFIVIKEFDDFVKSWQQYHSYFKDVILLDGKLVD